MARPSDEQIAAWRQDISIHARIGEQQLDLVSTWGLFSPEAVDEGSRLLLDHVDAENRREILDLGRGYGVLGLTLALRAPQAQVLLVDKDFVAVEYARRNIERLRLTQAQALLSNGLQHIPGDRRFDLVVCNLPAKASKEQHYLFLVDVFERLRPGGEFVVVSINGLREFMARTLTEVFGQAEKRKQGATYTISAARKHG